MFDLFVGYSGLAVSFVIFAVILLWIFIKADNISWKAKLLTIPLVLAYTIILYYIPINFMGHASPNVKGVCQVIILKYFVVEGDAIYFLVLDYNKENIMALLPRPVDAVKTGRPTLYKIKYNSDTHKALIEAQNDKDMLGRGRLVTTLERLQGFNQLFKGKKPFDLMDPANVLKKEPEE